MLAEVLFPDPDAVALASAELNKLGFDVDVLDLVDPVVRGVDRRGRPERAHRVGNSSTGYSRITEPRLH